MPFVPFLWSPMALWKLEQSLWLVREDEIELFDFSLALHDTKHNIGPPFEMAPAGSSRTGDKKRQICKCYPIFARADSSWELFSLLHRDQQCLSSSLFFLWWVHNRSMHYCLMMPAGPAESSSRALPPSRSHWLLQVNRQEGQEAELQKQNCRSRRRRRIQAD